ncbi:MAG: hypothetical protein D6744_15195 [Planctomycetota bacterium]|nr:MAG: hypothetical protein D6744_15195 [Planctomycetota bacterium]
MKRVNSIRYGLWRVVLATMLAAGGALANEIPWRTVDGGASETSLGTTLVLQATIGQHDAGALSGASQSVIGGYWSPEPDAAPCTGDLDGDNQVSLTDLAILLSDFDCVGACAGDVDMDGDTDITDLALLLSLFDASCN